MNSSFALFKKELMEFSRNYKLLILTTVFLFFAILSPLTAKFMPEILTSVLPQEVANSFPEPTAFDSWEQFFKNISQLGLFLLVIIFGSILTADRQNGTLVILLTKGLKRSTVIFVKSTFAMIIWSILYWLASAITFGYTAFYWPNNEVQQLFLALFLVWVFGLFIISLIILCNVLFRSFFSTLLSIGGVIVILFILSIFPKLENISLLRLLSDNNFILKNMYQWHDYTVLLIVSAVLILAFHAIAIMIFNRKTI